MENNSLTMEKMIVLTNEQALQLVTKYAFVRTTNARYDRALITQASASHIKISYKVSKGKKVCYEYEHIPIEDITELRPYAN